MGYFLRYSRENSLLLLYPSIYEAICQSLSLKLPSTAVFTPYFIADKFECVFSSGASRRAVVAFVLTVGPDSTVTSPALRAPTAATVSRPATVRTEPLATTSQVFQSTTFKLEKNDSKTQKKAFVVAE